jgi:adenylate cyclase
MEATRAQAVFDWLLDGARGAPSPAAVVERIGVDLGAAGVPVDRISAYVMTLHPDVLGRSFLWERGREVVLRELPLDAGRSPAYLNSPMARVTATRRELRIGLAPPPPGNTFPIVDELVAAGFTDYLALPMVFQNDEVHVIAFATKATRGFSDDHLAALRQICRPLSQIAEILALRRTTSNLLSTYVGRRTAEHILSGGIAKGDFETIRAAIWFSDLRGFTDVSGQLPPDETIGLLNALFECQVPAIEAHGGEVLKFIGDGLLAIFPIASEAETVARCTAALDAARQAFAALDAHNATAARAFDFGLALHVGEIAYGNIGGAARLDFTAIGPTVNIAARLEGLTGKLGKRLVASDVFARQVTGLELVGEFALKGIAAPQRVFAPRP